VKYVLVLAALLARPVRAEAKGCHEVSHVVGYEKCTWFGTWSRDVDVPPIWLDFGFVHHRYTSEPYTLDQSAARAATPESLDTLSDGFSFRALYGRVLYGGVELNSGWLVTTPKPLGSTQVGYASDVEAHAIAGVHVALWRFGLGPELAAGGRAEDLANCNSKDPACHHVEVWQSRRALEARVHADVFIAPSWSFGISLGKSLIDRDDTRVVIYTGLHFRALDGAP
jgi:hypothetical protein